MMSKSERDPSTSGSDLWCWLSERLWECDRLYPERFAQAALGHNSKAVHRAYAKIGHGCDSDAGGLRAETGSRFRRRYRADTSGGDCLTRLPLKPPTSLVLKFLGALQSALL